jgi:hypothetical protein
MQTRSIWFCATLGFCLLVFAVVLLRSNYSPDNWETRTREESIRILRNIRSTNELQNVVGNGGVVLTLSDGSWIVIRNMVEFEPNREVALAHDSGGGWFETQNRFSGG